MMNKWGSARLFTVYHVKTHTEETSLEESHLDVLLIILVFHTSEDAEESMGRKNGEEVNRRR